MISIGDVVALDFIEDKGKYAVVVEIHDIMIHMVGPKLNLWTPIYNIIRIGSLDDIMKEKT